MTTIALCLEQTLGHRAHAQNLDRSLGKGGIESVHVEFGQRRLPAPWALRASAAAVRTLRSRPPSDVTFFHTQSVSLFASLATRGRPYVVSVDATPKQMDDLGAWYSHRRGPAIAESLKERWYRRVFKGSAALVAWSEWAADSLVADYAVARERIEVVAPGAGPEFFAIERAAHATPRILFVGGDFTRKGGELLLRAFDRLGGPAELAIVTGASVDERPGVSVIRDATPGSTRLLDAYASADIFCLPTYADCTSIAIQEALAAGLPVVTTTVGSNAETIRDGENGLLVPPGDEDSLVEALSRLVNDEATRVEMGHRGRERARESMNAADNALRIGALLRSLG